MPLVSPCCKAPLNGLTCSECGQPYEQREGVPVLLQRIDEAALKADASYANGREPWTYGQTAPEQQKYDFLAEQAARAIGGDRGAPVADIGCSSGHFTERLLALSDDVTAIDLSLTSIARVSKRLGPKLQVAAASSLALPFATQSMQLLVLSDGLISWGLDAVERGLAVKEAKRALRPGGTALFMEYLNPRRHHELLDAVREHFTVGEGQVHYLSDRLWYVTESMFRVLRGTAVYGAFDRSRPFANALRGVSATLGRHGSKHLCVVVSNPAAHSS